MILNIENLGIVKQAKIDLMKPFTIFCGRNSTGKTYVSYILQAFLSGNGFYDLPFVDDLIDQVRNRQELELKKDYIVQWLDYHCKALESNTDIIFGISEITSKKLFDKFHISVDFSDEDYMALLKEKLEKKMSNNDLLLEISKEEGSSIVHFDGASDEKWIRGRGISLAASICLILRKCAFFKFAGERMLTVERNSIYTFKTELSLSRNELIDRLLQKADKPELDVVDILTSSSRRYPNAVRSSLRVANDLNNVQKNTSKYADIAEMIENEMLSGEVTMTKEGDVEFHATGTAKSKKIPFHLSSSIVKTMASLVIYLRHLAHRGDVLIIDEPEMNFHPEVQMLFPRIFAILINRGLHLVISTHSDYVIREVNNLIMVNYISEKIQG